MYKMHSRNFKTPKIKNMWEDTETNKWTQRGLQQTPKWNKGNYKKRDVWIEDDNTTYEKEAEQRYGKSQKKESIEILEIFSPFSQTKKHSWRPLQQTTTSGRENLRAQR
jgi:hypothetical protein